jgi:hypothetical protein
MNQPRNWMPAFVVFTGMSLLGLAGALVAFFYLKGDVISNAIARADSRSPQQIAPAPTADAEEPTDAEIEEMMIGWIDQVAGHPDDPTLPKDVLGASDDVLMATDPTEISELIQTTEGLARQHEDKPRLLFSLGRAALLHGYTRDGRRLLNEAAAAGSPAAYAYLGFDADAQDDTKRAIDNLQKAIDAGFDSPQVRELLDELSGSASASGANTGHVVAPAGSVTYDARQFNRPDWIDALYRHDVAILQKNPMMSLLYMKSIHETLWSDNVLFLVDDRSIVLELDATLSTALAVKMSTSPDIIAKSAGALGGSIGEGFAAFLEARRSGADIFNEAAALHKGLANIAPLDILTNQAVQDGRRLALLYETDPETFRRIYTGIKLFVHGK